MADRIVVLRDGMVEQIGSPLELYDRPGNIFVATFIGSPAMNLLSGAVRANAASLDAGGELSLPPGVHVGAGQRVTIGFRPEHLRVVSADAPGAITCRVEVLEFTGADTFLACEKGGKGLQVIVHQRLSLRAGDALGLAVDTANLHVFDEASERRLD